MMEHKAAQEPTDNEPCAPQVQHEDQGPPSVEQIQVAVRDFLKDRDFMDGWMTVGSLRAEINKALGLKSGALDQFQVLFQDATMVVIDELGCKRGAPHVQDEDMGTEEPNAVKMVYNVCLPHPVAERSSTGVKLQAPGQHTHHMAHHAAQPQ